MEDKNRVPEPTVMGIGFIGIFKFIKIQKDGAALLQKVMSRMSEATAALCSKRVITVMDYPYPAFIELLRTVDAVVGFGDLSLCRDIGEYAANRDYEFFFGPNKGKMTPNDLFRDCNVYWKSYYKNAGYMKTESSHPDKTAVRIYDFPQMDAAHCRLMEGWMAQAMVNAGVVWIEYGESCCTSRGDEYHEFSGRWKMAETGDAISAKTPRPGPTITKF